MITSSKDDATGAAFHQADPSSAFGKVFSNNMDDESFVGEPSTGLSLILNNSKTATFQYQGDAMTSPELKKCLVSLNILESDLKKSCLNRVVEIE